MKGYTIIELLVILAIIFIVILLGYCIIFQYDAFTDWLAAPITDMKIWHLIALLIIFGGR